MMNIVKKPINLNEFENIIAAINDHTELPISTVSATKMQRLSTFFKGIPRA